MMMASCFGGILQAVCLNVGSEISARPAIRMCEPAPSHRNNHRHRQHASYFDDRREIDVVATEHVVTSMHAEIKCSARALLPCANVACLLF